MLLTNRTSYIQKSLAFISTRSYYFVQQIAVIKAIIENHVGTPPETVWLLSLE